VTSPPLLRFEDITKTFGAVRALDGVSFDVRAGSVHALLGENGAGKSTLLGVLGGAHAPSVGRLSIAGREREGHTPAHAFAAGVAVIHQELHLVPAMTVAENLFLGHLPARLGFVDRRELARRARELLERVAPEIGPDERVAELALGQRQRVEIAKALSRRAQVLAFDEPTSSLSAREVERLFAVIRALRDAGCAVLYVTHRLDEVFELCDAATVLRDGRHVATHSSLDGVGRDELVRAMVGRSIEDVHGWSPRELGPPALEVEELLGRGLARPTSFAVRRGEIVGLFGLVGAGRSALLWLLAGAERPSGGRVRVHGTALAARTPREALAAGVALCPEDRRAEGLFPGLPVLANLNVAARRGLALHPAWERAHADAWIRRLRIRAPSPDVPVATLSGGNQQKVILGRWLARDVRVLLLDEPTRGVDVGARSELYELLQELARQGVAILMASSDLPEVLGLSDRVLVMREGGLAGELARGAATQENVLRLALPRADVRGDPAGRGFG
jgi:L-arabinose transport system ATP-binding protein